MKKKLVHARMMSLKPVCLQKTQKSLRAMNSSTIEVYRNCSHFVNALEALGAIFCERSCANQVKYNSIEN